MPAIIEAKTEAQKLSEQIIGVVRKVISSELCGFSRGGSRCRRWCVATLGLDAVAKRETRLFPVGHLRRECHRWLARRHRRGALFQAPRTLARMAAIHHHRLSWRACDVVDTVADHWGQVFRHHILARTAEYVDERPAAKRPYEACLKVPTGRRV